MGLGERCDEIVRLIDETLAAFSIDPGDLAPRAPSSGLTSAATPIPMSRSRVTKATPFSASGPTPERAGAGF